MAILKAEVEFETGYIQELVKSIPELSGGFLGLVGARARKMLREDLLSGQEINVFGAGKNSNRRTDSIGRRLVTSDVNRARTETKVYSYPVNLFETGRGLPDGSREPGKYIITRKLKQMVTMGLASYVTEYDRKIQKDIDKIL